MSRIVARPFKHDCDDCIPVGWHHVGDRAYNVYFCPGSKGRGTIILRYGDSPEEYASLSVWPGTTALGNCGYGPGVPVPSNIKQVDNG